MTTLLHFYLQICKKLNLKVFILNIFSKTPHNFQENNIFKTISKQKDYFFVFRMIVSDYGDQNLARFSLKILKVSSFLKILFFHSFLRLRPKKVWVLDPSRPYFKGGNIPFSPKFSPKRSQI